MQNLITPEQRHLIWKDETGDTFLLTDFAEIYRYSDTELAILFFKKTTPVQFLPILSHFRKTDEPLWYYRTNIENLPEILAKSKLKRRPNLHGKFIKNLEVRLGHKIIPYRPRNLAVKGDGKFNQYRNLFVKKIA